MADKKEPLPTTFDLFARQEATTFWEFAWAHKVGMFIVILVSMVIAALVTWLLMRPKAESFEMEGGGPSTWGKSGWS